jgi:hypothetical protein
VNALTVAGVDLAAKPHNPTGVAFIRDGRAVAATVRDDEEVIEFIERCEPAVIAIDAPLLMSEERYAERFLRRYRALPLTIPDMRVLCKRAIALRVRIENARVIEVFPTATAKILGFYIKPKIRMMEHLCRILRVESGGENEHEVDAIICAYTALLHVKGCAVNVGGVVVPKAVCAPR